MSKASKQNFFEIPLQRRTVQVERLGEVELLEMDGVRRDEWEAYVVAHRTGVGASAKQDTRGMKALSVVLSVVGEDGKMMFSRQDMAKVNDMSGAVLDSLFTHIRKLNGLEEDSVKAAEGNSVGEGSASNGSASPNV